MLSIISGTPFLCAILANFSMSQTFNAGFAIVSPKTAFVFGLNAFRISSSEAFSSTNIHSIPSFFKVTANKLTVPPYIVVVLIKLSPALQRFIIDINEAA